MTRPSAAAVALTGAVLVLLSIAGAQEIVFESCQDFTTFPSVGAPPDDPFNAFAPGVAERFAVISEGIGCICRWVA